MIPLQPIIDAAQNGNSITLAPGTYIGPIRINKMLKFSGEGKATILNTSPEAEVAVRILSDGVQLESLNIQQNNNGEAAAVRVEADKDTLKNLAIHTAGLGIVLREANGGIISNNKIRWLVYP
ncbi:MULTISPECIES: hypothetical protein [unclassified Paenibacillus]|uniref:hypothetical protein n=1 Tax=unclassified Paenibacillus TaxID=185978 RepID=UPI0030F56603